MPIWAWILVALLAAVVGGVAVYVAWVAYLLHQFSNTDL